MKHSIKRLLNLSIVIICFASLSLYSFAATNPNADAQNKDNWCWIATSKMVGAHNGGGSGLNTGSVVLTNTGGVHSYKGVNYYGVNASSQYTADAGQHQLIMHVKSNDNDQTGNSIDAEKALKKAAYLSSYVNSGTKGSGSLSTTDISDLKMDLSTSNWVIGWIYKSSGGVGHCITIKSYNTSTKELYYYDPWDNAHSYFDDTGFTNYDISLSSGSGYRLNWFTWCKY